MTEPERPRGGGSANAAGDILRAQSIPPEPPGQAARRPTARRPDSPQWLAAKAAEQQSLEMVAEWFKARGYRVTQTIGADNVDLVVQTEFEVKHDLKAQTTGNVAIETEYNGRASGIQTSTAPWWAIVVGTEGFIMETKRLRDFVLGGHFREAQAGDRKAARVRLVPVETLRGMPFVRTIKLDGAAA